jgi:predicted ABC-type ATPase
MKELVVISGKGGTGKTSLAASFAVLADRPVVADCDVDAAEFGYRFILPRSRRMLQPKPPQRIDHALIRADRSYANNRSRISLTLFPLFC